jgi:23S rRNA (adenine2503-C2)-methyltransferase
MAAACEAMGCPAYRARQIWRWVHVGLVADAAAMTDLPATLRADLAGRFVFDAASIAVDRSTPDGTRKFLVRLADGDAVEEVLIPANGRQTVCVSSQVGCRFKCSFCASGQAGFRRNLEAGEIVAQVLLAARALGERPGHVVYMGMGEPLDNYDAVLKSVRIVNDRHGLGIGARRITISTCGVIPGIERLAGEGIQVELSVSLHAADDALRSRLMPVNRRHPLDALLQACSRYSAATGRIVTFEYTLVAGVNDRPEHARLLAGRLAGLACRVNLIPLSPVREFPHEPPGREAVDGFARALQRSGINTTVRLSKGAALEAACGQLRFGT